MHLHSIDDFDTGDHIATLKRGNRFILGLISRSPSSLTHLTLGIHFYDTTATTWLEKVVDWGILRENVVAHSQLQTIALAFYLPEPTVRQTTSTDRDALMAYAKNQIEKMEGKTGAEIVFRNARELVIAL